MNADLWRARGRDAQGQQQDHCFGCVYLRHRDQSGSPPVEVPSQLDSERSWTVPRREDNR
jgi:hypothetical protein